MIHRVAELENDVRILRTAAAKAAEERGVLAAFVERQTVELLALRTSHGALRTALDLCARTIDELKADLMAVHGELRALVTNNSFQQRALGKLGQEIGALVTLPTNRAEAEHVVTVGVLRRGDNTVAR